MNSTERLTLPLLHDLAFLYLVLAYGTDKQLKPVEKQAIEAKLLEWLPEKNPALINHIIREVTLSYLNRPDRNKLEGIVDTLSLALPAPLRLAILRDLNEIATADRTVSAEEYAFISWVAKTWDISVGRALSGSRTQPQS